LRYYIILTIVRTQDDEIFLLSYTFEANKTLSGVHHILYNVIAGRFICELIELFPTVIEIRQYDTLLLLIRVIPVGTQMICCNNHTNRWYYNYNIIVPCA